MGVHAYWVQRAAISLAWITAAGSLASCSGDSIEDTGRTGGSTQATAGTWAAPAPGVMSGASLPPGPGAPGVGVPSTAGTAAPALMTCAEGVANTSPVTPTVWLVIDGSGSMADEFGGSTRWEALRSALMAPDGLVSMLQQYVRFGMVIYSGAAQMMAACNAMDKVNFACGCYTGAEPACCTAACGGTPPPVTGSCADLITVDPALSNFAMLDTMYPMKQIGGWTPTDRALEHVVTNLPVLNNPNLPDMKQDPIYVILATDGAPNDQCTPGMGGGVGASGFQPAVAMRVVNTVTTGVQKGMHMFVISLAGMDTELRAHLDQVSNIGSPGTKPFEPATKNDLVAALQQIIGGATCQVALNGTVAVGQECQGQVNMNGSVLPCNSDNGWRLADERTVQLTGTACTSFLGVQSQVRAAFPCEVFRPD